MLYKHVPISDQSALLQVYTWFATKNNPELSNLRRDLGEACYLMIGAAFVCESIERFEILAGLPQRSGKAVLPLIASIIKPYLETRDTRIGVAKSRETLNASSN